jgi:hypothetical protein
MLLVLMSFCNIETEHEHTDIRGNMSDEARPQAMLKKHSEQPSNLNARLLSKQRVDSERPQVSSEQATSVS